MEHCFLFIQCSSPAFHEEGRTDFHHLHRHSLPPSLSQTRQPTHVRLHLSSAPLKDDEAIRAELLEDDNILTRTSPDTFLSMWAKDRAKYPDDQYLVKFLFSVIYKMNTTGVIDPALTISVNLILFHTYCALEEAAMASVVAQKLVTMSKVFDGTDGGFGNLANDVKGSKWWGVRQRTH